MSRTVVIGGVIVLAVVVAGAFWLSSDQPRADQKTEALSPGSSEAGGANKQTLPEFSLPDFDGAQVTLADLAGKPLVVNVWASWCPFCVDELPDFVAAQQQYGDQVIFVAIDRAESSRVAQEYVRELGLGDELLWLLDLDDSFYIAIGGFSMPETVFVTADGQINFHKRGPMKLDEIIRRTDEIL
ncbi:TlpA family protein disulfide reductase [Patescibacteria group bacterium]|nr:TlpA family protein disulfide reductase [Patescibacteria group bacterium]